MRIISGEFKGRVLASVPDGLVRPVTDRVKSTIFNMLQNRLALHGADVLDLFAGSGSLGFEALSRGARNVVFVELHSHVIQSIKKNIMLLKCDERCEVLQSEGLSYLQFCKEQFDLIFADPPYAFGQTHELPDLIFQKNLLRKGGFLIIEHTKLLELKPPEQSVLVVTKEFGQTRVSFLTHQVP